MDENFLRMACERPFYVSNKTKMELKLAVERDSKFLCDIKVMDYSLLVGKDETTNELVVGIIDYLRPFSIDKVIESQVKSYRFKKRSMESIHCWYIELRNREKSLRLI